MKIFHKTPLALGVAAGMAMLAASTGAQATNSGTDLNLSAKARSGGMAGAAYTMPQEASAAIFGNPATLTQFKGINVNFGASMITLMDAQNQQQTTITGGVLAGTSTNKSNSDANNYVIPDLGISLQVSPNLVIGTGLEVDSGLGADYRDDPLSLFAGALAGAGLPQTGVPLLVEVISFSANLAAAYQVTDQLSVGASATIGFGLAQLGTAGPTIGLDALSTALGASPTSPATGPLSDFGGTTSSVHDIGFGATLGATYLVEEGIMLSATVKSPLSYNYKNIIFAESGATTVHGHDGYQDLTLQNPTEVIFGVALDNVIMPGLLVEADAIWKNWSDAQTFQDVFEDQWLLTIGAQYKTGDWTYRAGYSYAQDILSDKPNNTLGGLDGLGSVPLGTGPFEAISVDVIELVQVSLVPVIWEHTVTAGIGYQITDAVSVDGFVSYAFADTETRNPATLDATALGLIGVTGATAVDTEYKVNLDAEIMAGIGINIALP
ncbi:hypothetical protein A9Q82_09810 [Cycloclasticus sp. 46_120_T64]|nr:hypothetical protein A9Q82_09810 [Cycloclasticus sp. 46_120_T64]